MPLLNGVLQLHDVHDVEKLCRHVLEPFAKRGQLDDYDDALTELIGTCWQLSERYDPTKDKQPNFASYAACILSLRVHDRTRRIHGRTRWTFRQERRDTGRLPRNLERQRPTILSLDAPPPDSPDLRLGDTLPTSGGDDPADRDPTLERMEAERRRHRTRDLHIIRQHLHDRAA